MRVEITTDDGSSHTIRGTETGRDFPPRLCAVVEGMAAHPVEYRLSRLVVNVPRGSALWSLCAQFRASASRAAALRRKALNGSQRPI
jgi:hypothetical protein